MSSSSPPSTARSQGENLITPAGRRRRWLFSLAVLGIALVAVPVVLLSQQPRTPVYDVEVVQEFPHDSGAFSQGLVVEGDTLLEGTGQYGRSTLREVELKTGRVKRHVKLHESVFGEGITVWKDTIIQLTWKQGVAYVYDRETLKYLRSHRYRGEGWGLTHNGRHLIMSDGTSTLRFIDPDTFRVVRKLPVREGIRRIRDLNELEFVNGEILANIWHSDYVARISPENGRVTGWIDLRRIRPTAVQGNSEAVLNGIAWDPTHKRLFVTGKNWPSLFEIKVRAVPR